jgi:thiamine-phosphate pyrophosphorylase
MNPAIDFRLYVVTNRHLCAPRALSDVVREACDAGARAVQLREKDLTEDELGTLAAGLRDILSARGATLFVNQSHPLPGMENHGLHFPESIAIARPVPGAIIGASTHSRDSVQRAESAGADFITFGPVFDTPAKRRYGAPLGPDRLADVVAAVDIPVFAIGGVTPARVPACLDAGAYGVAVMGAIMAAADVVAVIRDYQHALGAL